MQVNLDIRFTTKGKHYKVLCFKHAVQAAIKDIDIDIEIDEFDNEYDMRSTHCNECFPGPSLEEED